MRKIFFNGLTAIAFIAILAGCVSIIGCTTVADSATVSYDPTMTPPMEVQRQADLQCARFNKRAVRRVTHAVDTATGLRYDDFDCVGNNDSNSRDYPR